MPTIVHFEIPTDDVERDSDLFGWKMEKWPGTDNKDSSSSSNMEYWIINTTDDKGKRRQ